MKTKIATVLGLLLETALIAGGFLIQYFTGKKMGMARHVIFKNQAWEKAYPLEQWKLISILVLAALVVLVLILLVIKRRTLTPWLYAEGALALGLTAYSLCFTLANSAATLRPYYWMSPLFALAALLQLVRTLALLIRK